MLKKYTCVVCGTEFWAGNVNARYCSNKCRSAAHWQTTKAKAQAVKAAKTAAFEKVVVAYRRGDGTLVCDGCIWRSKVDSRKCVMPTCLKGIGAAHDRG